MSKLRPKLKRVMRRLSQRARWRQVSRILLGLILALLLLTGVQSLRALSHRNLPTDGVFVLGGSIRREMYSADYARWHPEIPILISAGSDPPCIYAIFDRSNAPMEQVWLEDCAHSTFYNFFYSLPILKRWQVRHVELITSASHLPRAIWMARIIFGAQGIWVEPNIVPEIGIPGNQETRLKTILDVTRAGLWSVISHLYRPSCDAVTHLSQINLDDWDLENLHCEHQGQVEWDY
ncbi:YdcF family protein [Sodalinema gerasimenkoae]|uniref:YdcF family protein n=1 Tax=Sodalinema gerasimenkoae TaxID=2862348 RepID=UPI001FE6BD7F|nr:YdcF family protein [Sodalinema gerasimenkoae]